jgi:hypothetical protein
VQVWEEDDGSTGHAEYLGPKLDGSFSQYYDSGAAVLNLRFQGASSDTFVLRWESQTATTCNLLQVAKNACSKEMLMHYLAGGKDDTNCGCVR